METKRARKPNFSPAECALILQLAEENINIIRDKFSSTVSNKKKNETWQRICDRVNALGVAKRTPNELLEKWRGMKGEASKDLGRGKSSQQKTGGGRPQAPLKPTVQQMIQLFGDESSFCGMQGGLNQHGHSATVKTHPAAGTTTIAAVPAAGTETITTVPAATVPTLGASGSKTLHAADTDLEVILDKLPTKKQRKVTTQDIQVAQMDILTLEKRKIEIEVENVLLIQENIRLEVEMLKNKQKNPLN